MLRRWSFILASAIMKMFFTIVLTCLSGLPAFAQLDEKLTSQIKSWRKGDAPPAKLLKFPDGKIDLFPMCGMPLIGSAEVGYYIRQIQDADLLVAIMFDYHAQPESIRAASSQLIQLKGVRHVSRLLTEKRKTDPKALGRSELAVLLQLLSTPYMDLQVARIASEDLPTEKADVALQAMKADLQAGVPWAKALQKHSDLHPDLRDRAKNPHSKSTLICYLHDSTVSSIGFDLVTYHIAEKLPTEHLRQLFQTKRGTHLLKSSDGVYLYHIQSYYSAD